MPELVIRTLLAAMYTGTNGAELLETVQQITSNTATWSIASDDGLVCVLREQQQGRVADWPVRLNRWLIVAPDFGVVARVRPEIFERDYRRMSQVAGLVAATDQMQEALTTAAQAGGAFGMASVPALTPAAQQTTVQVQIRPELPTTDYAAAAFISGSANLLAGLEILSVAKVSGARVDVTIRLRGVAALSGGIVAVHCT